MDAGFVEHLASNRYFDRTFESEAVKAEGWHRAALQKLGAAQTEANKFCKLIDLETAARRDSEARSEAKSFDEMALLRFRVRER